MLKKGNGEPKKCVENLASIIRGEVPFDRVRGIDARIIDMPSEEAMQTFEEEIRWNIETYEPRVDANNTTINVSQDDEGELVLDIGIAETDNE